MYLKDNFNKYKKVKSKKSIGSIISTIAIKILINIFVLILAIICTVLFVKIVSPIILTFIK